MTTQSLAEQLRAKRSEMMLSELERVALELFDERGFAAVTVEELAGEAQISVRTFYRYFPSKDDILQLRIDRRAAALAAALAVRPVDEAPLHSVRMALTEVAASEDDGLYRRWTSVLISTPALIPGVLGGVQLKVQRRLSDFLGRRLGMPADALVPTMLAATVAGVVQAAHGRWFLAGGDYSEIVAEGLTVLESGIGDALDPSALKAR